MWPAGTRAEKAQRTCLPANVADCWCLTRDRGRTAGNGILPHAWITLFVGTGVGGARDPPGGCWHRAVGSSSEVLEAQAQGPGCEHPELLEAILQPWGHETRSSLGLAGEPF